MKNKIIRKNPFDEIYKNCNKGSSEEKLKQIPAFPVLIDIELTNKCNFHCLMCPTGTKMLRRKQGTMTREIFNKILDEIGKYKTPVRFSRWGEPFLHPDIITYISDVKKKDILCHINTNGSLLTNEIISSLIKIPLDSIKISFQGINRKTYAEMRNTDLFDVLLNKVKYIFEQRGDHYLPFISASTTVTYENSDQIKQFHKQISPYIDALTIGRTVLEYIDVEKIKLSSKEKNVLQELKSHESVVKKHPECPEVFDKLSINWDGTVSACCGDFDNVMMIGDIKDNSLKSIWHSKKMNAYRSILANMRHDDLPLCKTCYDYHGLETPGLQNIDFF
ncbi:radical SAM protein [Candidatus Magnetomorum sp. HK-1]|nr:radical SAM protein [Candidatus Magnetomorum sp. HK-1]